MRKNHHLVQHQHYYVSSSLLLLFFLQCIITTTIFLDQSHITCSAKSSNLSNHHIFGSGGGTGSDNVKNVKAVGTRMTGVGSRSKKNKSIFLHSSSKSKTKSKSSKNVSSISSPSSSIRGRMYVKMTKQDELLLLFPSQEIIIKKKINDNNQDDDKKKKKKKIVEDDKKIMGTILSLSTKDNYDYLNFDGSFGSTHSSETETDCDMSSVHAQVWKKSVKQSQSETKKKKRNRKTKKSSSSSHNYYDNSHLSEEWIPIEGLYGVYNLPSGSYLVLITDSEAVYESPKIIQATETSPSSSSPLINLRRVKSMEIVKLPPPTTTTTTTTATDDTIIENHNHYSMEEEKTQFRLLRESFKEHDFYYSSPKMIRTTTTILDDYDRDSKSNNNSSSGSGSCLSNKNNSENDDIAIRDITHTLQRFFAHLSLSKQTREDVNGNKEQKIEKELMDGDIMGDLKSSFLLMPKNKLFLMDGEQFDLKNVTYDQVLGVRGKRSSDDSIFVDEKSCDSHHTLSISSGVQHSYSLCKAIISLHNIVKKRENRDSDEENDCDGQNSIQTSW